MSKSHSRMYLKLTDQNLKFANSLSLSLSVSLSVCLSVSLSLSLSGMLLFHPHASCKYGVFFFWARSCYHRLYWKECYRTGGNRTRDLIANSIPTKAALFFCCGLSWNTCICYGRTLLPLLQDWKLQVSDEGCSVVNRLCISIYWRGS